jgi:hypothetical protein
MGTQLATMPSVLLVAAGALVGRSDARPKVRSIMLMPMKISRISIGPSLA